VLFVDDEPVVLALCRDIAHDLGMIVDTAATTEDALDFITRDVIDLVVTDIRVPEIGGMGLIKLLRSQHPEVGVVVVSAHGTIETAVEALHSGAIDYITKPFLVKSFEEKLRNVAHTAECNRDRACHHTAVGANIAGKTLIGNSQQIRELREQIARASKRHFPVLVLGETGTGKEIVARSIHFAGSRARQPFIPVDCAAITQTLAESELFGYEKGAFTGATSSKQGLVEAAHTGTLFLDEIGELPKEIQPKLLRALQEKQVRRIGSTVTKDVDIRVIARPFTLAYGVILMLGMAGPALAQDNGAQQPPARQQLQRIHTTQSIDQELARLTKDLELFAEQQRKVRPLLEEHHDRIQALLDKNPTASRQELGPQIHVISDDTHHRIHALLTDHQKELEKAMQQREHDGGENRRSAPPAAASAEPFSSAYARQAALDD
jgi:DNA-binding response OmpR family regulator